MDAKTLTYLFEASLYQLVFLAFYWFFLKKDTFFTLNRSFLLLGLLGSVVLPVIPFSLVSIDNIDELASLNLVYNMVATPIATFQQPTVEIPRILSQIDFISIVSTVYLLGAIILGIRFTHNIFKLLTYSTQYKKTATSRIIYQKALSEAFSFFSKIYLPHAWAESEDSALIIAHEEAHVQFWHSVDRLLMDTMAILFWFNPFIHIYRKALIENHEYHADFAVIKQCDKSVYQQLLLVKSTPRSSVSLASGFSSLTKKRIIMMNKNKSAALGKFKLVLILPILIVAIVISSYKPKSLAPSIEVFVGPDVSKSTEWKLPIGSDIPSIFPVQYKTAYPLNTTIAKVRVSSTFGDRKDPFSKTTKFHKGIDIATRIGAPVIATANGVVTEVEFHPEGYGKYIWLTHADGYATRYAQLSNFAAKVGDKVTQGQIIGYVGSTGKSTAPHLHYEVTKDGKAVNPVKYIKDFTFDGC